MGQDDEKLLSGVSESVQSGHTDTAYQSQGSGVRNAPAQQEVTHLFAFK